MADGGEWGDRRAGEHQGSIAPFPAGPPLSVVPPLATAKRLSKNCSDGPIADIPFGAHQVAGKSKLLAVDNKI